jgi:hypothetical protein
VLYAACCCLLPWVLVGLPEAVFVLWAQLELADLQHKLSGIASLSASKNHPYCPSEQQCGSFPLGKKKEKQVS